MNNGAFAYSSPVGHRQAVHWGLWASLILLLVALYKLGLCKLLASKVSRWFGVTEETYTDEGKGQGSGAPGKAGAGEAKPAKKDQDGRRPGR